MEFAALFISPYLHSILLKGELCRLCSQCECAGVLKKKGHDNMRKGSYGVKEIYR